MVGTLLGLVIVIPLRALELTSFSSLPSGRFTSRTFFRADYAGFFQIIFLFFLIVMKFRGAEVILSLNTCS